MRTVKADTAKEQKRFLNFRRQIYRSQNLYVDNNYYLVKEIFAAKLNYVKRIKIYPLNVVDDNENILCQGIIAYSSELPEYIQLCFFEALKEQWEAVDMLLEEVRKKGHEHNCQKMVIGLYGHVNYALGFQDSGYGEKNSFAANANEKYYNDYFRRYEMEEVKLNTYKISQIDKRLERYSALFRKLYKSYEFRFFDKKQFDYYSKIYTDLNNECFVNHRYYYHREYEDDREMLEELFMFMKEDSLIFAFKDNKPVAFVLWYPDYNELAKPGEAYGAKHYVKNLFMNKRLKTAKVMEFGVLEKYKKVGIPLALLHKIWSVLDNYGCEKAVTSWILDENIDSNSICKAVCDETDKEYVVYEQTI